MIKRPLLIAGITGAALLTLVGGSRQPLEAAPRPSVTIGRAFISPKRLRSSGGPVSVRLKVTARNATISAVRGQAKLARSLGSGAVTNLTDAGGGNYTGSIQVPGNSTTRNVTASLYVTVTYSGGTKTKRIGRVIVEKFDGDPTTPPAPPNI